MPTSRLQAMGALECGDRRAPHYEQLQHLPHVGVIGSISFADNSDNAHGVFRLYRVQDSMWVFVR